MTRPRQQQQRGGGARRPGEAPAEAVKDRAAQAHDLADLDTSGGEPRRDIDYPATNPPHRKGDITPRVPSPRVEWDDIVQPERRRGSGTHPPTTAEDDLPLPEGK